MIKLLVLENTIKRKSTCYTFIQSILHNFHIKLYNKHIVQMRFCFKYVTNDYACFTEITFEYTNGIGSYFSKGVW